MKRDFNLIKSDKFKTNYLQVRYLIPASKQNMTYAAILSMYLTYCNNVENTYKKAYDKLDKLYGVKFDVSLAIKGNQITFDFYISFISSKYLINHEQYLNEVIKTFFNFILDPLLANNTFSTEELNIKKYELEQRIKNIYDDKMYYATEQFFKYFAKGYALCLTTTGYLDELKLITEDKLYDFYQKYLNNPYIIGMISSYDYEEIVELLNSKISYQPISKTLDFYTINNEQSDEIIEQQDIFQSKLLLGYSVNDIVTKDNYYIYLIINVLFGMTSNSYLFKIVREQENLCYTIRSNYDQYSNSFVVFAGIEKINYQKTIKLVEEILNKIKKGLIKDNELREAKIVLIDVVKKLSDSQEGYVNYYLNRTMQGLPNNLEEDIKKINEISLDEIIIKAQLIELKTKYLLSGEKSE